MQNRTKKSVEMKKPVRVKEMAAAVENALERFLLELPHDWHGKERDAVSRFVFGYLINECRPKTALYSPAQIGIEIPVGKPRELRRKKKGSWKDVVIWQQPGMTAFNEKLIHTFAPSVVIEWKVRFENGSPSRKFAEEIAHDHEWLAAFTSEHPHAAGYSVFLKSVESRTLELTKFSNGNPHTTIWTG